MHAQKTEPSRQKENSRTRDSRLHMANERTFLAWIRTSIGIMVFGFVVERFAVPNEVFGPAASEVPVGGSTYLARLGLCLVLLGVAASVLATVRFLRIQKHILEDTYKPSVVRYVLLAILLGSIGVLVAIHLAERLRVL